MLQLPPWLAGNGLFVTVSLANAVSTPRTDEPATIRSCDRGLSLSEGASVDKRRLSPPAFENAQIHVREVESYAAQNGVAIPTMSERPRLPDDRRQPSLGAIVE